MPTKPENGTLSEKRTVVGCDIYNLTQTGDVAVTITANACSSSNHAGPSVLILNDQGGRVMDVTNKIVATLRAEEHGHQAVICFEPGIARRLGGHCRYTPNVSPTLRADAGDNRPAVCYAIDHVVTTGGNCTAQGPCFYKDICPTEKASGVHAVCFERQKGTENENA